jgi:hypothetical protein
VAYIGLPLLRLGAGWTPAARLDILELSFPHVTAGALPAGFVVRGLWQGAKPLPVAFGGSGMIISFGSAVTWGHVFILYDIRRARPLRQVV